MNPLEQTVLTIAGSDSGAGAGIQADLKSFAAHEVYGASVITAITAQNTTGVTAIEALSPEIVKAQLDAVFTDLNIVGVKVGMVTDQSIMQLIADAIQTYQPKYVVVDPVMVSTTGHTLLEADQIEALTTILLPLATVITPNLQEAEVLLGYKITSFEDMKVAAKALAEITGTNVLIKGGHFPFEQNGRKKSIDVLSTGETFTKDWIETSATHGTGCSLSSAICANLAKELSLIHAIDGAKYYVHQGIEHAYQVGHGSSPIHHFYDFWEDN
ncbi:MAG: bifunctional hydroxymethylpyrimidine kinase/phosphomethylpyrimidine kinase [Defluviitaleaceae bacterium]|nr:bifunctional hydroxymethylpyrimidine kinase/phosphomethylpyrimidine kinase [Defluviitaleaceae bacterium]